MRKILPVFVLLCSVLFACVRQDFDADNDPSLTITDARAFFYEYEDDLILGGGDRTRGLDDNDPLADIQPNWDEAQYSELLGEEVVEVPFEGILGTIRLNNEETEQDENDNTPPPSNTVFKLIAGLTDYGDIYYNVLYITSDSIDVDELCVASLDDDFSGMLHRYEVSGDFIGGIVVSAGEITKTISEISETETQEPETQDIVRRAPGITATCETTTIEFWVYYDCTDEGSGDYYKDPSTGNLYGDIDVVGICQMKKTMSYELCEYDGGGGGVPIDPPGGGGGNPDGEPEEDDEDQRETEDPCEGTRVLQDDSEIDFTLRWLRNSAANHNFELGSTFGINSDSELIHLNDYLGYDNSGALNFNISNPIVGFIHSHYEGTSSIFTIEDLFSIFDLYNGGQMSTGSPFFFGVVLPDGNTYMLYITDWSSFGTFAGTLNGLTGDEREGKKQNIFNHFTALDDFDIVSALNAITNGGMGMSMINVTPDNEVNKMELGGDYNTTAEAKPC